MKPRQFAPKRRVVERAIILTRVSSDGQADNTSHETQLHACEEFCRRRDWGIVARFEEVESGTLYLSRVETQAALEMIEGAEADVLVLYDMTRYGRDVEYQHKILKRIIKAGGQLQFASFPMEYDENGELTPEYEQIFNMQGGASAVERKFIRRRLATGKKKKIEQGIQLARFMAPYGWKIVDKKSIIRGEHPPELEGFYLPVPDVLCRIVPAIFEPYARGASLGELAVAMQDANIPTPRGGRLWRPCGVRYILQNPVYMGRPAYGRNQNFVDDERIGQGMDKILVRPREMADWQFLDTPRIKEHFARPDIAPFLVPESVWWECQKRLDGNRAERSGRKDRKYPLSGLLRCHLCGRKLVGRKSDNAGRYKLVDGTIKQGKRIITRQYVCVDKVRFNSKVADRCASPLWNAVLVEDFVCEAMRQLLSEPQLLAASQAEYERQKQQRAPVSHESAESLKKRLEQIKRREQIAAESKVEARMNGTATAPFDAMLVQLAGERNELEDRLRAVTVLAPSQSSLVVATQEGAQVAEALADPDVSDADKNAIYATLIQSIEILPDTPDARFQGRASGARIRLQTGTDLGAILEIKQLKTKRKIQIDFLDSSNQRHK